MRHWLAIRHLDSKLDSTGHYTGHLDNNLSSSWRPGRCFQTSCTSWIRTVGYTQGCWYSSLSPRIGRSKMSNCRPLSCSCLISHCTFSSSHFHCRMLSRQKIQVHLYTRSIPVTERLLSYTEWAEPQEASVKFPWLSNSTNWAGTLKIFELVVVYYL